MADDETQGPELMSWWTSDVLDDSALPPSTFDEPLLWPESPAWGDIEGAQPSGGGFDALVDQTGDEVGPLFIFPGETGTGAESDAQWGPSDDPSPNEPADQVAADDTVQHLGPLAGLGGGGGGGGGGSGGGSGGALRSGRVAGEDLPWPVAVGAARTADPHTGRGVRSPELGSIWSNDFRSDPENLAGFAGLPAPAIYADTERSGGGWRWRGFDIRPGNAAVIGLISVVSLVLLGMFLSVRARNDTPTDTSQARPTGDEISVTGPLNTVPLTTTVTSTTLAPVVNIADLLPPTGDAGSTGADAGSTAAGAGTPTVTTAPARPAAATGGGTAMTTATTRPTATTAPAPPPTTESPSPPATSPPATSPPATSPSVTTPTTRPPTPTPTFTIPVPPTYTIPTFPGVDRDRS